jgi:hypothetical protein
MASKGVTKKTNADFLHYCLKRVWMANGASEEHADTVADGLMIGIRQRKLTQGLAVSGRRLTCRCSRDSSTSKLSRR